METFLRLPHLSLHVPQVICTILRTLKTEEGIFGISQPVQKSIFGNICEVNNCRGENFVDSIVLGDIFLIFIAPVKDLQLNWMEFIIWNQSYGAMMMRGQGS